MDNETKRMFRNNCEHLERVETNPCERHVHSSCGCNTMVLAKPSWAQTLPLTRFKTVFFFVFSTRSHHTPDDSQPVHFYTQRSAQCQSSQAAS